VETEIWKPIPGTEKYEVSNLGQIRLGKTKNIRKLSVHRTHHGKEYLVVTVADLAAGKGRGGNNKTQNLKVGRCVLFAFVGPPPPDKPLCCHEDDDGFNNRLDNLKWGSHAENQAERVNPLCEHCTKKCRLDSHEPESGQCQTIECLCIGWKKKVKTLFAWGKSLEKQA
jgi:hypothetical protein